MADQNRVTSGGFCDQTHVLHKHAGTPGQQGFIAPQAMALSSYENEPRRLHAQLLHWRLPFPAIIVKTSPVHFVL
jgi:hypothetical protein